MKRILALLAVLILCFSIVPASAQVAEEFPVSKEAILSALYEADISDLREAIDLKLITCEELTAFYLERIDTYNQPYNCFITMCDDALDIARQRDAALAAGTASGTLFGIPIVIKDNIDLAGYHTTNGHKKTDKQIAQSNAQIVDYLLAEGAIIIAKANMSLDAQSARDSISKAVGETKNAYSKYMSSAGSSGGSAVATSLNFAAASLGTDTNSSLRLPATYAGCVSLRGTHDLISRDGVIELNGTRDIPGAITRTVYDQAILLDALTAGQYHYAENLNAGILEGLRIGVIKELCYGVAGNKDRQEEDFDPEITAAFANALAELQLCGAELVEVSMPNIFKLSQATRNSNKSEKKEALYNAFTDMLAEYDVCAVVFPTYLSTPLRSGRDAEGTYWNVWSQNHISNCAVLSPSASLPEITVPIGLHTLGCGIGMEIAAPKYQEQLLLDIAYAYTERYDHRILPEGAPDTYSASHAGTLAQIIEAYKLHLNPPPPTVPETTVPETTGPEPTVPQPTTPEPTVPEPTVPEPTIPEPTVPATSAPPATDPAATTPVPTQPQPNTEATPVGWFIPSLAATSLVSIAVYALVCKFRKDT